MKEILPSLRFVRMTNTREIIDILEKYTYHFFHQNKEILKFKIRSTCIATVAQSVDEVHTARDAVAKQMQVIQYTPKTKKQPK